MFQDLWELISAGYLMFPGVQGWLGARGIPTAGKRANSMTLPKKLLLTASESGTIWKKDLTDGTGSCI